MHNLKLHKVHTRTENTQNVEIQWSTDLAAKKNWDNADRQTMVQKQGDWVCSNGVVIENAKG
jgi:hypothetical protein